MATLAELIGVKEKTAIERFILCVKNALWLDILRYQIGLGLWISSSILLLAGLINLFFYNLLISSSLTLALLPLVGGFFVAIKKMPTFADAASHADQLFNGKSLMATATELLYTTTTAPRDFSPWVIKQAACSAQRWHEQFKQPIYHQHKRFPSAAMGIALLGLFFILQPGISYKHEATRTGSKTLTPDSKPVLAATVIDEIRRAENVLKNEALSPQGELTEHVSSANKPAKSNADTHLQPNKVLAQVNELPSTINKDNAQISMVDPSQGSEAGNNQLQPPKQRADAGIGTQADTNPSLAAHKDIQNRAIKLVDIELHDGISVSSDGKGIPFKEHQLVAPDKRVKLPSTVAAKNTSIAYTTRFSHSQQQYANAYFKNIHPEK